MRRAGDPSSLRWAAPLREDGATYALAVVSGCLDELRIEAFRVGNHEQAAAYARAMELVRRVVEEVRGA